MDRSEVVILIVDRNPHVREFLHRELLHMGFTVKLGRSCTEVEQCVGGTSAPKLIVLDPDLPGQNGYSLLEILRTTHPEIPVIAHVFSQDAADHPALKGIAGVVEKNGRVDELKQVIMDVLTRCYPDGRAETECVP